MNREEEKNKLREAFKAKREALSPDDLLTRSEKINENFLHNLLPHFYLEDPHKIFSLYFANRVEVSTSLIAKHFTKNHIHFSYPKIIEKNHHLEFVLFSSDTRFVANKFFPRVIEPEGGEKILPDILILPLLAFDSKLSRLGMGGGFFDRTIEFLKKRKPKIVTVGFAFDFQRIDGTLPVENTDQRLDFVVTEKNLFSASRI